MKTSIKNKFCAAPFTSMYEGQFGKVTACCAMKEEIGNSHENSLEEIFNNDTFKSLRKSFLNNEFPKQCVACSSFEERHGVVATVRKSANAFAGDKINLALAHTRSDGTLDKQVPVYLDLLWSNKCNFACLGCKGELSSTIATKYNEAFAIAHNKDVKDFNSNLWSNTNKDRIDYILKYKDTIDRIHLNGGEPFMQKGVFELLDAMIEHDLHKTVSIWAHTNGSISSYKGKNLINDYLSKWGARCSITISHDGHGKRGEYVRYGLKQDKWLDTMRRFTKSGITVNIQTCYNVFNALNLAELYNWYETNTSISYQNRKINAWYGPAPYIAKVLQLDKTLLDQANNQLDILAQIKKKDVNMKWDLNYLRAFLNSPLSNKEIDSITKNFRKSIDKFDELRNTNFLETFPELAPIYLNCSK